MQLLENPGDHRRWHDSRQKDIAVAFIAFELAISEIVHVREKMAAAKKQLRILQQHTYDRQDDSDADSQTGTGDAHRHQGLDRGVPAAGTDRRKGPTRGYEGIYEGPPKGINQPRILPTS